MARKIAISELNASTLDIINTIRAHASLEYQQTVPEIDNVSQLRQVGDVLFGYPALANQFLSSLINRVAMVKIKSATFNNDFVELKKGYLEYGETVEEVFVRLAKAREFSAEKGEERELKRTLPKVETAFHTMNYKVQYPITIQQEDLRQAFMSEDGLLDLVAKILDSVYTGADYDEYLLFKYLMIKAIARGKMFPIAIDESSMNNSAVAFRGASNKITFISNKYNSYGVRTATPKKDQYIFMDADYNAKYDVNVLASAFNMDKADFTGKLKLIDDWTTFDNERFSTIIENSDTMEEITDEELELMKGVKAVLVDEEWFQIYDNHIGMTETQVASGMYWNYFYNVWKTVSSSPFSNAIVFVSDSVNVELPENIDFTVGSVVGGKYATTVTLNLEEVLGVNGGNMTFVQSDEATTKGVAIHPYGAIIVPNDVAGGITLVLNVNGTTYTSTTTVDGKLEVGDTVSFSKGEALTINDGDGDGQE